MPERLVWLLCCPTVPGIAEAIALKSNFRNYERLQRQHGVVALSFQFIPNNVAVSTVAPMNTELEVGGKVFIFSAISTCDESIDALEAVDELSRVNFAKKLARLARTRQNVGTRVLW